MSVADSERYLQRWREIIDLVANQMGDLLWQREQIRRIGKLIDENAQLRTSNKPFLWDARRWYMFFAVMRIRSQADKDDDVYSLRRVLEEMREHPHVLNREMVASLARKEYRDPDPFFEKFLVDGTWKDFAAANGGFDVDALTRDIDHLDEISKQVRRLANKSIAHTTKQGLRNEPKLTFKDLDDCIDAFDAIAVKYIRLLQGAGFSGGTLMPTEQFDWYEQFSFAWKPREQRREAS